MLLLIIFSFYFPVTAYKQAKTNLSNDNPLSHSDLQALSNAIDNPVNNAKEAEKMLSNLSELGSINFGKCNVGYVLHRIEKTTLLKCVKECLKLANCTSISYFKHILQATLICKTRIAVLRSTDPSIYLKH
jgi:hypothetical protein